MISKLSHRQKIAIGTLIGIALTIFVWLNYFQKPLTPGQVAKLALTAALNGDAAFLLRYQHDHEKRLLPLTEMQLRQLLDYSKTAILKNPMIRGEVIIHSDQAHQGVAYVDVSSQDGHLAEICLTAESTPLGPRVGISSFFSQSMSGSAVLSGHSFEGNNWRSHRAAMVKVASEHQGELTKLGLPGLVGPDPDGRMRTWQGLIEIKFGATLQFPEPKTSPPLSLR